MQVTEVIVLVCNALCFELTQGKRDWEMARKVCIISLLVNLGIYEGLDNVMIYFIPKGSQSIT